MISMLFSSFLVILNVNIAIHIVCVIIDSVLIKELKSKMSKKAELPTVTKSLRINSDIDKQIIALAKSNHVTYTSMANILLSRALQDPQLVNPNKD